MKTKFLILLLAVVFQNVMAQGIAFEHGTFTEALAKAKSENKLLFMDCYTTWCGPCKMMSKDIFPLAEVGQYMNDKFISIKIDMEKGEGIELAKKYEVKAFPTLLFIDQKGEVVHTKVGAADAPGFIEEAKKASDPSRQLGALTSKYNSGNRELGFMSQYIQALYGAYNMDEIQNVGSQYIPTMTEDQYATEDGFTILAYTGINYKSKPYNYILAHKEELISNEKIGKQSYDYAIGGAIRSHMAKVAKEGSLKDLNEAITATKKDYSFGEYQAVMENAWVNDYYMSHKMYSDWIKNVNKQSEALLKTDKKMAISNYINTAYSIAVKPEFKDNKQLYTEAFKMTAKVQKVEPNNLSAYFCNATLYKNQGNKKEGLKAIENYLKYVDPAQNNSRALTLKNEIEAIK